MQVFGIGHACILASGIGQCQAKTRVMSDESYFTTDTATQAHDVLIFFKKAKIFCVMSGLKFTLSDIAFSTGQSSPA